MDKTNTNKQDYNIRITPYDVKKLMEEQIPIKASGQDGIQNKHLQKLSNKIVVYYYMYKKCNYFPPVGKMHTKY